MVKDGATEDGMAKGETHDRSDAWRAPTYLYLRGLLDEEGYRRAVEEMDRRGAWIIERPRPPYPTPPIPWES